MKSKGVFLLRRGMEGTYNSHLCDFILADLRQVLESSAGINLTFKAIPWSILTIFSRSVSCAPIGAMELQTSTERGRGVLQGPEI